MSLSNISIKTLNILDKSTLEYKKKVIKDIYETYLKESDFSLEEMIETLLKRKPPPKKILIKRPRTVINCCNAKVWNSINKEYGRCKINKVENIDYCGLHKNKQNYGNI